MKKILIVVLLLLLVTVFCGAKPMPPQEDPDEVAALFANVEMHSKGLKDCNASIEPLSDTAQYLFTFCSKTKLQDEFGYLTVGITATSICVGRRYGKLRSSSALVIYSAEGLALTTDMKDAYLCCNILDDLLEEGDDAQQKELAKQYGYCLADTWEPLVPEQEPTSSAEDEWL